MCSACAKNLVTFFGIKPTELGYIAAGVFSIYLDQTGNKEFLFLICLCLPIVWLAKIHSEADIASPGTLLRIPFWICEGVNAGHVVEIPCLPDGECSVRILFGFMHAHPAGLAHSDNNDPRLLGLRCSCLWRRRGSGVCRELEDTNMRNVCLKKRVIDRILLAEAAIDDPPLLLLEALSSCRHARGSGPRAERAWSGRRVVHGSR